MLFLSVAQRDLIGRNIMETLKGSDFSDKAAVALCWCDYQDFDCYMKALDYDPKTDKIQARKQYNRGRMLFRTFRELGFTYTDMKELCHMSNDIFNN